MTVVPGLPFPSAGEARSRSRDLQTIWSEIAVIQSAILSAIQDGKFSVDVTGTTMAGSSDYYDVWVGNVEDFVKKDQMESVIGWFESIGYTVLRITDPVVPNTFFWRLSW